MDIYITNLGILIEYNKLRFYKDGKDVSSLIRDIYTIKNLDIAFNRTKTYKYYKFIDIQNKKHIVLPRFSHKILPFKVNILNYISVPKTFKFDCTCEFQGNQKVVFDEVFESYFNEEKVEKGMAGVLIKLGAGQGKTFLAVQIMKKLSVKTLIIVHSMLLLEQWKKVLQTYTNATVGAYYSLEKTEGDIVIAIINSVFTYPKWSEVGLTIYDEAHLYLSTQRCEVFFQYQTPYILGLTATPDAKKEVNDNRYKTIEWFIGPILNAEHITGYRHDNVEFFANVQKIEYYGSKEHTITHLNEITGMPDNMKTLSMLMEDPYRNQLILNQLEKLYRDPQLYIIVFSQRRKHLQDLQKKFDPDNQRLSVVLLGGASTEEIEYAENHSRVIFTTYTYFGTGKSIPRFNSAILGLPFKTMSEQYINRVFRLGSDSTITREIIDIVDMRLFIKNQWYKRKQHYNSKNYKINTQEYYV